MQFEEKCLNKHRKKILFKRKTKILFKDTTIQYNQLNCRWHAIKISFSFYSCTIKSLLAPMFYLVLFI